jgi:hypothetical protein
MKKPRLAFPGRFLAVSLLLSAGCSREKPATTASEPAKQPPPPPSAAPGPTDAPAVAAPASDPLAEMKASLERATLEQHDGLAGVQQRMDQEIDAQVAAKKAGADVSLAADKKLDEATQDFAEKLRMLSVARPETWNTAKHDAAQALQNVQSAYAEIMGSPARR